MEAGHPELNEAELQQLCASLPVNGELWAEGESMGQDDHALEQEIERDYEMEQEGKASPVGSDSSSIPDDMGSEPKRTLPFRKGPNFTMEKFLDPSRPYKCTVCKESFTQKNILLVHYNSVSHLHKLKRFCRKHQVLSLKKPTATLTTNPTNAAFVMLHIAKVLHWKST